MSLSGSGHGDVEGAVHIDEGGGGLKLIDSGIPPPKYVLPYCESNSNRLDVRWFRSMRLHGEFFGVARSSRRQKRYGSPRRDQQLETLGSLWLRRVQNVVN